jgi:hypothetical protein
MLTEAGFRKRVCGIWREELPGFISKLQPEQVAGR